MNKRINWTETFTHEGKRYYYASRVLPLWAISIGMVKNKQTYTHP